MEVPWDPTRAEIAWLLVGLATAVVVGLVVYAFLGAVVVGVFLYYATRPVYRWLDDRSPYPDLNATATLLCLAIPIVLVLGYAALLAARELDQFLATAQLHEYRSLLRPYVTLAESGEARGLLDTVRSVLPQLLNVADTAFTWLLRLIVAVAVAFYLLRDDRKLAAWYRRTFGPGHDAVTFMERVDEDLTTIYTGNLITIGVAAGIAVAVYYGLDLIAPAGAGVAIPILLGLLTGIATLIPAVGMKLVYVPYAGFLVWRSVGADAGPLWFPAVFVVVTAVVVDFVPDIFVRSYVSKGDINMGLIVMAYVLTPFAVGWYGVFLGPIVLVFFVHFSRTVLPSLVRGRSTGFVSK